MVWKLGCQTQSTPSISARYIAYPDTQWTSGFPGGIWCRTTTGSRCPRVEVENGEYIWELKHGVILEDCVIAYKWWAMIALLGTHISSKEAHQRSETKGHEVLEPTSSVRYLHEDRTRSLQKRRWKHTCFNGHKLIRWEIRGYCFKEPPGFPGKFRTISLTWKNQ